MLVNMFNGGLSTRLAQHMIGVNEAIVYENIDNALGTLTPIKRAAVAPEASGLSFYPFWYEAGNKWLNSGFYMPKVELNRLVYEAGWSELLVHTPTESRAAGVLKPPTAIVASARKAPSRVTTAQLKPNPSASPTALPQTTHSYILLNKNATGYSSGLNISVEPTSRTVIRDFSYYRNNGIPINQEDFELTTTNSGFATFQTVTIGPASARIEAGFGIDVYRLYKGVHYLVGTLVSGSDFIIDSVFDISANQQLSQTMFAQLKGTYQYLQTSVNAAGIESQPSELSAEVDLAEGGNVFLNTHPYNATGGKTRIYRVGGNLTVFSLVAEIPGTQTTYTDSLADVDIDGRVLTSQNYAIAPAPMSALIAAYGMLFGAYQNTLRFTNPGEPEYWPAAYSLIFPLTITGLAAVSNGVLVMTATSTYLVTGTGPLLLSVQLLSGDQGCVDAKSVQVYKGNAIWVSGDGICVSPGSEVEVISKDKLGKLSLGTIRSSVLFDEVYYVTHTNNSCFAVDFRFGAPIFKTLKFAEATANNLLTMYRSHTALYFTTVGGQYKPFAGSVNATMRYKSPRFIEGRATENKTYKKVFFYVEGEVTLKVYINNELVMTRVCPANTVDSVTVQVPQAQQRGFFIQFEVEGTGQIYELEYLAQGRPDE